MTGRRHPARSAPTLEAVAERAGVSRSTVSRVVNGSPKVTDEARAAVDAAIAELGYVPNHAARSLASRRSHAIALVIQEATPRIFTDPYFGELVGGAVARLAESPYTLTLLIESESDPHRTRRYLLGGSVDGAIIISTHRGDRSYAEVQSMLPIVFSGRPIGPHGDDAVVVDIDNTAAGREATEYLLAHGRRRIATITGPMDMAAGIDRLAGWRSALETAGLEPGPIEIGDFTPHSGRAAMERLLANGEEFDGLFAASAQMAFGALELLRERGIRVPEDLSVIGIDNDRFAETADPPLTTIEQPTAAQGGEIADVLVRLIEGRPAERLTIMPTRLVERASV